MSNYNNFFGLGGNSTSTIATDFDTKKAKFVKLLACGGKEFRLYGYMITKPGKFGKGIAFCATEIGGDGSPVMIDLPKRYLDIFSGYAPDQIALLTSGRMKATNIRELPARDGQKATFVFDIDEIK